MIAQIRQSPAWQGLEAVARTLVYDLSIMGDTMRGNPLPADRWDSVTVPTLVMDGGASPEFFRSGARALADLLPKGRHRTLAGQTHGADPEVLAPMLEEFFAA
jgi:hypothetical protein